MKRRTLAVSVASALGAGVLALTIPADAGTHPTPTPTPTQLPTVPPTVNPFAGCNFSTTFDFTFDPARGRFVRQVVPAIVCDQNGRVRVYDLVPGRR
jgi:hypothetical protein